MVDSEWFDSETNINIYQLNELMATKLRALHQRRKGRDLFDLWYVLSHDLIDANKVIDIFQQYNAHNDETITRALFEESMAKKIDAEDFRSDMNALLPGKTTWPFEEACEVVQHKLISKLPGEAWKGKIYR